jgi:hypothetical protein
MSRAESFSQAPAAFSRRIAHAANGAAQFFTGKATPATVREDTQHRFGVLDYANPPGFGYPVA